LSKQYALLLHCRVRLTSSPICNTGETTKSKVSAKNFLDLPNVETFHLRLCRMDFRDAIPNQVDIRSIAILILFLVIMRFIV
jgi:hypothetical protein